MYSDICILIYQDVIVISYFIDNLTNMREPRMCDKTILCSINMIRSTYRIGYIANKFIEYIYVDDYLFGKSC